MPKISVLMPVWNGEKYLREAIESILNQTFADFEFIIIDDGSTDSSDAIIKSFSDPRIIYIKNEANLKLAASLNRGLKMAQGKYLSRMDGDDIARPERLQAQFDFMEKHPDIDLCGAWAKIIDSEKILKMPARPELIAPLLLFYPPLIHPSVFWRLESFNRHQLAYDESFSKSQDFELWSRAAKFLKITNLKKVLLDYRLTIEQINNFNNSDWRQNLLNTIRERTIKDLLPETTAEENEIHKKISNGVISGDRELALAEKWLEKLIAANQEKSVYAAKPFKEVMRQQWLTLVRRKGKNAAAKIKLLLNAPILGENLPLRIINLIVLTIKIKLS
jgi:glycosyltransferase involved in cell wall biosynthesis